MPKVEPVVVVVVTSLRIGFALCALLVASLMGVVQAATLAPDSADVMYHRYEGGGMTIDGPSILVRKSIGSQVSVSGQYYVDTVSAASVDVIAEASPYEEERTEYSGGIDYIHEKSIFSAGYTNSSENDYEADTVFVSMSQDVFGDLTNIRLGYARGWDDVGKINTSRDTWGELDRQVYQFGLSQILTKSSFIGMDVDVITEEGTLENPYRSNYYLTTDADTGRLRREDQPELYPDTRTSTAIAFRGMYYLPYKASIRGEYRWYRDTWDIVGHTFGIGYSHTVQKNWIADFHVRYYTQDAARFYSDLYPRQQDEFQTHVGRDKELSTFNGTTIGFSSTYEIGRGKIPFIKRLQMGLQMDYLSYKYDDFRNVTVEGFDPGTEPFYKFHAWVTRLSFIVDY